MYGGFLIYNNNIVCPNSALLNTMETFTLQKDIFKDCSEIIEAAYTFSVYTFIHFDGF